MNGWELFENDVLFVELGGRNEDDSWRIFEVENPFVVESLLFWLAKVRREITHDWSNWNTWI